MAELWDVLDENGNKTGRLHERGVRMAEGDFHLVVHVWKFNRKGEWLIDKRSPHKAEWPDWWETTGGSAVAGDWSDAFHPTRPCNQDDSLTAALRETKEELGIDLDPEKGVLFRREVRRHDGGHNFLLDIWVFGHDCGIDEINFPDGESCEAMWASTDKIREMTAAGVFWNYPYFEEMIMFINDKTKKGGV